MLILMNPKSFNVPLGSGLRASSSSAPVIKYSAFMCQSHDRHIPVNFNVEKTNGLYVFSSTEGPDMVLNSVLDGLNNHLSRSTPSQRMSTLRVFLDVL